MNNKLCVITGANSGIGYETALDLAARGAFVIMVCRNEERAEAARQRIIRETGNPGIEIVLCDFSIQSEIRKAAEAITGQYQQVDVLINNHGVLLSGREETVDGLEKTFAVNHIGYFLFTHLLLDAIKDSDYARIINIASEAHRNGSFNADDIQLREGFKPLKAYANSKLYNILFTSRLARELEDSGVTANAVHPGMAHTNFGRKSSLMMKALMFVARPFMISSKKGARTGIHLAVSEELAGVNGAYFKNCRAATPSKQARDKEAADLLWDMSMKLCGL